MIINASWRGGGVWVLGLNFYYLNHIDFVVYREIIEINLLENRNDKIKAVSILGGRYYFKWFLILGVIDVSVIIWGSQFLIQGLIIDAHSNTL